MCIYHSVHTPAMGNFKNIIRISFFVSNFAHSRPNTAVRYPPLPPTANHPRLDFFFYSLNPQKCLLPVLSPLPSGTRPCPRLESGTTSRSVESLSVSASCWTSLVPLRLVMSMRDWSFLPGGITNMISAVAGASRPTWTLAGFGLSGLLLVRFLTMLFRMLVRMMLKCLVLVFFFFLVMEELGVSDGL